MLIKAFQQTATEHPDRVALAFGQQSWTFSAFDDLTNRLAENLLLSGIAPGDRVALHFRNCPEMAFALAGCLKAGVIAVPINPRLKGTEVDYILRHSGSAGYLGQAELYAELERSCTAIENLAVCYLTDSGAGGGETRPFEELLLPPRECEGTRAVALAQVPGASMAVIIYTSGTTAFPKGVVHTHDSLWRLAAAMRDMRLDETRVAVIVTSMAHLVGLGMILLPCLVNGAQAVISEPGNFGRNLDDFERRRGTYTIAFPMIYHGLIEAQQRQPRSFAAACRFFIGGDAVPLQLEQRIEQVLGPVSNVYGATEIAPICWVRHSSQECALPGGSLIGAPALGTEVRVMGADGRRVAQPGEVGELQVRGDHLMAGYWKDEEATAAALRDGWFRTGDLGSCLQGGDFGFAGRAKEIIIHGGSNVSPQEVEAVLQEHPAVREAGVVGVPDPVWGEIVTAGVAVRPGYTVSEADLIAFARQRLADYKTPERIVFLERLPQGPTGKVQRRLLKENLEHVRHCFTDTFSSQSARQTADQ